MKSAGWKGAAFSLSPSHFSFSFPEGYYYHYVNGLCGFTVCVVPAQAKEKSLWNKLILFKRDATDADITSQRQGTEGDVSRPKFGFKTHTRPLAPPFPRPFLLKLEANYNNQASLKVFIRWKEARLHRVQICVPVILPAYTIHRSNTGGDTERERERERESRRAVGWRYG